MIEQLYKDIYDEQLAKGAIINEWKPTYVCGNLYEVSNVGQIKRLSIRKRHGRYFSLFKEKLLLQKISKKGYSCVTLQENKRRYDISVHRLVAMAFVENPDNKPTVNHKDGDKRNNTYTNLEWATNKEQMSHADSIGLRNIKGQCHTNSKLTDEIVKQIREIKKTTNSSNEQIAKMFGVYQSTIQKVNSRTSWKHI